jgi:hypothetical protein
MKYRVDFLLALNGKIVGDFSANGETLEAAIFSVSTISAPHIADGCDLGILRVLYLCECGSYHPVAGAVDLARSSHGVGAAESVAN